MDTRVLAGGYCPLSVGRVAIIALYSGGSVAFTLGVRQNYQELLSKIFGKTFPLRKKKIECLFLFRSLALIFLCTS